MTVAAAASRILLDNVSISYATPRGRLLVVDRVSLAVDRAEFVVLVGPSGSGKSTILRAIAGLNAAESGIISVDGQRVDGPPEHIGFMFQRDTLLPWLTVRGNIEIGLELAGVASAVCGGVCALIGPARPRARKTPISARRLALGIELAGMAAPAPRPIFSW